MCLCFVLFCFVLAVVVVVVLVIGPPAVAVIELLKTAPGVTGDPPGRSVTVRACFLTAVFGSPHRFGGVIGAPAVLAA